jgi:hypothetical protein
MTTISVSKGAIGEPSLAMIVILCESIEIFSGLVVIALLTKRNRYLKEKYSIYILIAGKKSHVQFFYKPKHIL